MIIGISGKLKSGKSTLTSYLAEYGFEELLFAGGLKDMICTLLGVDRDTLNSQEFKETEIPWVGTTPRKLMQTLGTEWGRAINPNLWVNHTLQQARFLPKVVISDVRFPNELQALHDINAITVRIVRDIEREGPEHQHPSETALDHVNNKLFDVVIDNNGSLEDLRKAAEDIINNFKTIYDGVV